MLNSAVAKVDARTTKFLVLRFLREQALADRGWRRQGVRGWHSTEEVEIGVGVYLVDVLPRAARQGWVDRVDIREQGRKRPVWLYRLSAPGARELARWEGTEFPAGWRMPEESDPEAGSLYVPVRAWGALEVLRRFAQAEVGPRRWGMHGWLSAMELTRLGAPLLYNDELPWLIARRLVERRHVILEGRRRPAYFYRPTALAMAAELVDAARAGTAAPTHVQLTLLLTQLSTRDAELAWAPMLAGETRTRVEQFVELGPGVDGMDTMDRGREPTE
jgi:hypothetical protein